MMSNGNDFSDGECFHAELEHFKDGWTYEEYRQLIIYCLMYVYGWPEYHHYDGAVKAVTGHEDYVRKSYFQRRPPDDVAADVGFSCG